MAHCWHCLVSLLHSLLHKCNNVSTNTNNNKYFQQQMYPNIIINNNNVINTSLQYQSSLPSTIVINITNNNNNVNINNNNNQNNNNPRPPHLEQHLWVPITNQSSTKGRRQAMAQQARRVPAGAVCGWAGRACVNGK